MEQLDAAVQEMDFEYLGTGQHNVNGKQFHQMLNHKEAFFLDVRTDEEQRYSVFPWAKHIPLHQLPNRLAEVPQDKIIIPFCSSVFRASIAWALLKSKGYERARVLTLSTEAIAGLLKPGPLYAQQ